MRKALVTGGSGFLGNILINKLISQGYRVYSVSRRLPEPRENLIRLRGDILAPGLGLPEGSIGNGSIDACYHLAAVLKLGEDTDGMIMKTNVEGTRNIIEFCEKRDIANLYYCSTAYTQNRNTYEVSKDICEHLVYEWSQRTGKICAIFKPSIMIGIGQNFVPGHFSQFTSLLVRILRKTETVRRHIQGIPFLPVLKPVFRLKGNPEGYLNLVDVEDVARHMAAIENSGIYWLTNPRPPRMAEIVNWVGEYIGVDLKVLAEFKPTPLESRFAHMVAAFQPYLNGQSFYSHIKREQCNPITREFVQETINYSLF
jgi:nucleoside-diphosphate-sugar epimerase